MPKITIFLPESFDQRKSEFLTEFLAKYLDAFDEAGGYSIQYEPSGEMDEQDGEEG